MIGRTLLHYKITAKLGEGGMGEVYRAEDSKLGREVAIKVLPEAFAADPERLARFEREAQVLASLNHPNIGGIYGLEEDGGQRFLVLELVPGETLAEQLARGALPLEQVLSSSAQIARALEAAHDRGIVHRDLKPANIKLTPDGNAKVLDFGLAKAWEPEAEDTDLTRSPTLTAQMTQAGVVLGTAAYMSPEQAKGLEVDKRADIWAYGVVVFEMLTGDRLFTAETTPETLAFVMTKDIDLGKLPASVPPQVRWLLRRCLERDPKRRLRDIGEARVALAPDGPAIEQPVRTRRVPAPVVVAFAAGVAVASLGWLGLRAWLLPNAEPPRPAGSPMRMTIDRPADANWGKLSPDGTRVLYPATGALWLRNLADNEARPISGTEGNSVGNGKLAWSADGRSVAFVREGFLETLRLGESRAERRFPVPERITNLSWADNGAFLFEVGGKSEGIYYVAPEADEPERLDWIEPETLRTPHRFNPHFLPGGDSFLLTDSSGEESWIRVASLASRSTRRLVRGATGAVYTDPGWLAWVDAGRLVVQPFDPETGTVSGTARELAHGVESFASTGEASFSFSTEGKLLYTPMESPAEIEWVDRQGRSLGPAAEPRPYSTVRLDRTGRWLAASIVTPETGYRDLWIMDLERGTLQRLTHRAGWEDTPVWSPDGKSIAFAADWLGPPNVYMQSVGGGEPTELVPFDNYVHYAGAWTADGVSVVYSRMEPRNNRGDLWIVDVATRQRRPLLESPFREFEPAISPDGRWIAYSSSESGRLEVHVASFPDFTGSVRVSADGGRTARWSRDSSQLYYLTGARAIATARIDEREGLPDPGAEIIVVQASEDLAQFDVTPDGDRFLVLRRTAGQIRPVSNLIVNWEQLLAK